MPILYELWSGKSFDILLLKVEFCFFNVPCESMFYNHATYDFWSDQHDFVNYFTVLIFIFLSFIAKGLAICWLGGVITTQKVLFHNL